MPTGCGATTDRQSCLQATTLKMASEGASCWICLEGGDGDSESGALVRNCACRGDDAGFAHLSCLAQYARSNNRDHMRKTNNDGSGTSSIGEEIDMNKITQPWKFCPNCKKGYGGDLGLDLARLFWEDVQDLGEDHPNYMNCLLVLADACIGKDLAREAYDHLERLATLLVVYEDSLMERTVEDPVALRVSVLDRLVVASIGQDDLRRALYWAIESRKVAEALYGEGHPATEEQVQAVNYLQGLIKVHSGGGESMTAFKIRTHEESYELLRRKHGEESHETLFSKAILGEGYCESGNSKKGMPIIEEAFQLCLRVYGPENDHSKSMRKLYSNAKARYGPKTAKIVGLESIKPEFNGLDAEVIKQAKDGKYIVSVSISGELSKFKALPRNLLFPEGTPVTFKSGRSGIIDSFDTESGLYTVIQKGKTNKTIRAKPEDFVVDFCSHSLGKKSHFMAGF